jgi:uncharacterized protein YjiS (DUF1127 family)
MSNAKISAGLKFGDGLKQAALSAVASIRFLARCASCYMQLRCEYEELARLSYRSLRDIGLTPEDVAAITARPIWRRCWQSVRACPSKRCGAGSICMTECRRYPIKKSDTSIK